MCFHINEFLPHKLFCNLLFHLTMLLHWALWEISRYGCAPVSEPIPEGGTQVGSSPSLLHTKHFILVLLTAPLKGTSSIHSHPLETEEARSQGQGLTRVARLDAAGGNADPAGAPSSVPSSLARAELRGEGAGSGCRRPGYPQHFPAVRAPSASATGPGPRPPRAPR